MLSRDYNSSLTEVPINSDFNTAARVILNDLVISPVTTRLDQSSPFVSYKFALLMTCISALDIKWQFINPNAESDIRLLS